MSWMCKALKYGTVFHGPLVAAALLLAVSLINPIMADEITRFDVTENGGVYSIKATVLINAPADYVRGVLTDYVHIYRLNPSIVESEVLDSTDSDITRVRTKVLGCVAGYCEELERTEEVRVLASGDIRAEVIPESGQFKTGITLWQIRSSGDNTELNYEAEIEPDFFIPPIIGSLMVKARLREEITSSFTRLEKIATIQFERDWNPDWNLPNVMVATNTVPCE